jgi:PhzF family phenazine biosynthesis protein
LSPPIGKGGDVNEELVHRLAAFTTDPAGGNPAGVVVTDAPLPDDRMQAIAAEVGYSETAFLAAPTDDRRTWDVRYFSPVAEVPFCGHATIASGVLLGEQVGPGSFTLRTGVGDVPVAVDDRAGTVMATLTSVPPRVEDAPASLLDEVLDACGLTRGHLDAELPPAIAFAGARHLVLVVVDRVDLAALTYDFDRVRDAMLAHDLTTVAVLWPAPDGSWHARNLFPVGGVVEDPATGAAAAALGAYLRRQGVVEPPASIVVHQGHDMGRPSLLHVWIPDGDAGIDVSGTAVSMDG